MQSARLSAPEPSSALAGRAPVRWNRTRRGVAVTLAAAFAVLLPASVASAWIRGTILSTSGYVTAVTPVAASPAVRDAIQDAVTGQVDAALGDAEASLPPAARALAGLLGTGLAGLARNGVRQLVASQAFERWWADANRVVHSQLISVLNGDSALATVTAREVVLNLLPLVNDVLRTVSGPLSAMTGGAVSLSAIPAAACHAITGTASFACRRIPLFPAAALAGTRHVYRLLVAALSLVLLLAALAFAGALAASPRRRRTLLQMTTGGTLTVLVVMTAVSWGQLSLTGRAAPRYQAVTSVVVHALTTGFFTTATWCVAGGLAITAIALLCGPYRWATVIRNAIRIGGLRASELVRVGIHPAAITAASDPVVPGPRRSQGRPRTAAEHLASPLTQDPGRLRLDIPGPVQQPWAKPPGDPDQQALHWHGRLSSRAGRELRRPHRRKGPRSVADTVERGFLRDAGEAGGDDRGEQLQAGRGGRTHLVRERGGGHQAGPRAGGRRR